MEEADSEVLGTFKVSYDGQEHYVGNVDCDVGWCDGSRAYPKSCSCGGLIHAEFGDYNSYSSYWLDTKCDKCGEKEH